MAALVLALLGVPRPSDPTFTGPVQLFLTQKALSESPGRFKDIVELALSRSTKKLQPEMQAKCRRLAAESGSHTGGLVPLDEEHPKTLRYRPSAAAVPPGTCSRTRSGQ